MMAFDMTLTIVLHTAELLFCVAGTLVFIKYLWKKWNPKWFNVADWKAISMKKRYLEGILQSAKFILEQYVLACFYLSFFRNWLSIALLLLNIQIIGDFHKRLIQIMGKDIIADTVEVVCIALVGMILIKFGYHPVSNIPNNFSIWKKCKRLY